MDDVAPVVVEIKSTSNFSSLVSPHLNKIAGHTSFFQFKFKKEKLQKDNVAVTKMYVKENSLEEKWQFLSGIKLFKDKPDFSKLEVSPFREDPSYDEIFKSVRNKYFPSLENKFCAVEIQEIKLNWKNRINFLIGSKPESFKPFDFNKLKPQVPGVEEETIREKIQRCPSRREAALTATFFPTEMSSFSVEDLEVDMSLVFYTNKKTSRPWIGLFQGLCQDKNDNTEVEVQWLERERRHFSLALNDDGSPYLSRLEIETIMFSDVLTNISPAGERSGPYVLDGDTIKEIKSAYAERDQALT